jgi:hypothetical protein
MASIWPKIETAINIGMFDGNWRFFSIIKYVINT